MQGWVMHRYEPPILAIGTMLTCVYKAYFARGINRTRRMRWKSHLARKVM